MNAEKKILDSIYKGLGVDIWIRDLLRELAEEGFGIVFECSFYPSQVVRFYVKRGSECWFYFTPKTLMGFSDENKARYLIEYFKKGELEKKHIINKVVDFGMKHNLSPEKAYTILKLKGEKI